MGDKTQTHRLQQDLPYGRSSYVYLSLKPIGTILIFVHGFGGSSGKTWRRFPELIIGNDACAGCDIVFYGYESMRTRSRFNAIALFEFLDQVCTNPSPVLNPVSSPQSQRPRDFEFNRVVLISHSLGGLISRQALLEACNHKRDWLSRIGLVMFAPAHLGADVFKLANAAFPVIGAILSFRWQSLLDLDPGGDTVARLQKDTAAQISNGKDSLIAKKVVLGDRDNIVTPNSFLSDPSPKVLRGKDHFEVCKPTSSFRDPLDQLLGLL